MTLKLAVLGVAAFALAVPTLALADPPPGHGHGNHDQDRYDDGGRGRDDDGYRGRGHGHHGKSHANADNRWGGQGCPPGLARKNPGCLPPGQWRKGDRLPDGWTRYYTPYDRLPDYYRSHYGQNRDYRYMYRDDRVYVVDAITRAIVNIIVP
ncbi:MAG: hypothetical protein KGM49_12350 [Sphingomonadales bacterium]|nr:hypothetical protein [Sphingomonadales bacterium]